MSSGPRVTVALPTVPSAEGGAAGRCALALVEGLRTHGCEVTALAARSTGPAVAPTNSGVRIVDAPDTRGRVRVNLDRVRRPRGELSYGPFAEQVRAASVDSDVLHLEQVESGWLSRGVRVPAVMHLHHLVRADRDLGRPWTASFREVAEFAAGERAAARRHRWFVASSPVVRDQLLRWQPGARIAEAPLSLQPERYEPAALDGPPVAGLLGTGGWPPTERAIHRLVRLWPRVFAGCRDARLQIAGRGTMASPALQAASDGVEAMGAVASAAGFLGGLSVLVYPVDRGSGMKVKVLEALACGVPVVTTARGAEGLLSHDGVVVSEHDDDLIDAIVALLRDPALRRQQGKLAREHFLRYYAPAPATASVVALYHDILDG